MGTVNLHAVHADHLRVAGGLGEGFDHVLNVLLAHAMNDDLPVLLLFHRPVTWHVRLRLSALATHVAHMPELRDDLAASAMHRLDDSLPAGQRILAIEARNMRVAVGCRVIDRGALGDDQPDPGSSTPTVVLHHIGGGYAVGRERPGHRRHDHTGRQTKGAQFEGLKQGLYASGHRCDSFLFIWARQPSARGSANEAQPAPTGARAAGGKLVAGRRCRSLSCAAARLPKRC